MRDERDTQRVTPKPSAMVDKDREVHCRRATYSAADVGGGKTEDTPEFSSAARDTPAVKDCGRYSRSKGEGVATADAPKVSLTVKDTPAFKDDGRYSRSGGV